MNPEPLQRTAEWYAARCGKITGSRIADVIGCVKNGDWAAPRAKYKNQLVAERLTSKPQDMRRVKSLDDRAELEPDAIACYEFYADAEVVLVGFVQHPTIEYSGASPDGLLNPDGVLELKCLDAANHVKLLKGNLSVMNDYVPQMQWEIACAERNYCDFVSFCPTMPEELKLYRKRVDRNQEKIDALETIVRVFSDEVDAEVKQILALTNGGAQ